VFPLFTTMTHILKEKSPLIRQAIEASSRILLHFHVNPDMDSVGSALGMFHVLKSLGKSVTIIKGDSGMPEFLSHLPGYESVTEKSWSEIDPADFDLFIILDSASPDRISAAPVIFPPTLRTVVIDHHETNAGFGDINLIDASYAAVGQMLTDLFTLWEIPLTESSAVCLLTAIYGDTGRFICRNTTGDTFAAAAMLANVAPNFISILEKSYDKGQKDEVRFLGLALSSIEEFSRVAAISCVPYASLEMHGLLHVHGSGGWNVGTIIKSAIGWEIGGSLIEDQLGTVRASFRSSNPDTYDLTKLASRLGGGGHRAAAGAIIKGVSFEVAKKMLAEAIAEAYFS
jgi:phosphoesterase RecJ-like protein